MSRFARRPGILRVFRTLRLLRGMVVTMNAVADFSTMN